MIKFKPMYFTIIEQQLYSYDLPSCGNVPYSPCCWFIGPSVNNIAPVALCVADWWGGIQKIYLEHIIPSQGEA